MYGIFVLLFALLASSITARPLATNPGFQISRLFVWEAQGSDTIVSFRIFDPDPLTNGTAECSGMWETGSSGYPQTTYKQRGNTTFAWNVASYNTVQSFTLGLEHVFIDPAVGPYPYNQVISFGKATIDQPAIECSVERQVAFCQQARNETIRAPIYATTAKLR